MTFQGATRWRGWKRLLLLGFSLGLAACSATAPPPAGVTSDWMKVFASPFLEFNTSGLSQQLAPIRWIYESPFLTFEADFNDDHVPDECRFRNFQILHAAHAGAIVSPRGEDLTAAYLRQCEEKISTGPKDLLRNLYRTLFIRFAVDSHPYVKRVILNLPNGYKLPGLIGLKDATHKRPWVILRAGIFGNSIDLQAERFMLLQLFEQGPFNVLFLDSLSSPETIRLNEKLAVGGLDEGLQNYQVARQLLSPQEGLNRLVSDVHMMAISMGGHGLWMAMLLNEVNPPVFKSAVAMCPLVQFKKTFTGLETNPVSFFMMNIYASFRMPLLMKRIPNIRRSQFLTDAFKYVHDNFKGPVTDDGKVRFPVDFPKDDFDRGNDLLPWIKDIKHPISIFATRRDDLVPFALNTAVLTDYAQEASAIRLYPLTESFHCSLPGAYSWNEMSALLKSQFLRNNQAADFRRIYWPVANLQVGQQINERLGFELGTGDEYLVVKVNTGSKTQTDPRSELRIQIPIGALAWGTERQVRNETEARILMRYAAQNITLGADLDGHLRLIWPVPADFTWTGTEGMQIR